MMVPLTPLGAIKPKSKSRTARYREANTPGTVPFILKRFFPRKGEILRHTEFEYFRLNIWGSADPRSIEARHRESTRNVKIHSRVANAAKSKRADERHLRALSLKSQGMAQKEIASTLGITTRGVRKLLKRNYR